MKELTVSGLEGLLVRVSALESAARALEEEKPGADESVRRLIQSIAGLTRKYDVPEIREALGAAAEASSTDLPAAVKFLAGFLRDLAARARTQKLVILVIDDDPDVTELLQLRLSEPNRDVLVASTITEAARLISERSLSLILLDLHLPDTDGRNLLLSLREDPVTASIPIVVITADTNPEHQDECLGLGADEYFRKPFDLESLAVAVSTRLRRSAEISSESHRDALTGLANRRALAIEFDRARKHASQGETPITVAMLDLDHFKEINDTYGHVAGDEVLKRLASVLPRVLRGSDFVCRWGGEEFVLVLPETDEAQAAIVVEKVLAALRSERFGEDGSGFQVTLSAGVAAVPPDASLDDVVAEADRRLYRAKSAGRNRVVSTAGGGTVDTIDASSS